MNLFKIFDATRKQREQIKTWAAKAGMDGEAIVSKVESAFETDAEQFAAARWIIKGYDTSTFKQALYICSQKKIDPMGVDPEELVQKNPEVKPKEKPINPDDVLTDRKDEGDGVVTYAARDEDREVLRQIINTHYGKDASPWCLLAGDGNGKLSGDSQGYWNQYSAYPKRVAFRNGKLLAFSAGSDPDVREWWDRMDRSFPFIPYDGKTWLGKNGVTYEIRNDEVFRIAGDERGRLYKKYTEDIENAESEVSVLGNSSIEIDGQNYEISREDDKYYYVDDGFLKCKVLKDSLQFDGLFEEYYGNGKLHEKCVYKNGRKDGPYEEYYSNGQLRVRCTHKNDKREGLFEGYYHNGQLMSRGTYENGELIGPFERYDLQGHLIESDE